MHPFLIFIKVASIAVVILGSTGLFVGCSSLEAVGPPQEMAEPRRKTAFPEPYQKPLQASYFKVDTNERVVALTFDDGPHATLTPQLLDILKAKDVQATFYVLGRNVQRHPEIARRIVAEGHEIANHSWSHPNLNNLSLEAMQREMQTTHNTILQTTGVISRNMRPPYGALTTARRQYMHAQLNYPCIFWSTDPEDWKRPGVSVVTNRLVAGAREGAILLAHDIHASTVQAMPATIDRIHAKGYRFTTVSKLLALERAPARGEISLMHQP